MMTMDMLKDFAKGSKCQKCRADLGFELSIQCEVLCSDCSNRLLLCHACRDKASKCGECGGDLLVLGKNMMI